MPAPAPQLKLDGNQKMRMLLGEYIVQIITLEEAVNQRDEEIAKRDAEIARLKALLPHEQEDEHDGPRDTSAN